MFENGVYSLMTADLGNQYYRITEGKVSKVEIMRNVHEEQMFRQAGWGIRASGDLSRCLAVREFAVIEGEEIVLVTPSSSPILHRFPA